MTIDSYKGESLGKKIGRAWFWVVVRHWLGEQFFTGKHLVLASREGGDVAVLKAMGVPAKNIVAMELNRHAAILFAEKHPDVRVHIGDVATLVNDRMFRGNLSCAHLDFCSWCTPEVVDAAVRVARFGMRDGGVLSIGVMKGREQGYTKRELSALKTIQDEEPCMDRSLQKAWPARDRQTWARMESSKRRRYLLLFAINEELLSGGPPVGVMPMTSVGYNSGKTPMLYDVLVVCRDMTRRRLCLRMSKTLEEAADANLQHAKDIAEWSARNYQLIDDRILSSADDFLRLHRAIPFAGKTTLAGEMEIGEPTPIVAATVADAIERLNPGTSAADVLTVRRGRLAAWRAHATRGTYEMGAAE